MLFNAHTTQPCKPSLNCIMFFAPASLYTGCLGQSPRGNLKYLSCTLMKPAFLIPAHMVSVTLMAFSVCATHVVANSPYPANRESFGKDPSSQ